MGLDGWISKLLIMFRKYHIFDNLSFSPETRQAMTKQIPCGIPARTHRRFSDSQLKCEVCRWNSTNSAGLALRRVCCTLLFHVGTSWTVLVHLWSFLVSHCALQWSQGLTLRPRAAGRWPLATCWARWIGHGCSNGIPHITGEPHMSPSHHMSSHVICQQNPRNGSCAAFFRHRDIECNWSAAHRLAWNLWRTFDRELDLSCWPFYTLLNDALLVFHLHFQILVASLRDSLHTRKKMKKHDMITGYLVTAPSALSSYLNVPI